MKTKAKILINLKFLQQNKIFDNLKVLPTKSFFKTKIIKQKKSKVKQT